MKKLLVLLLIVSSGTIFAQTKQGNILLSGGAGLQFISSSLKVVYDGVTQGKVKLGSFSLMPSFGYFVIDNLAIGLAGNITISSSKFESEPKDVSTTIMLIPSAIYYIPSSGKVRPLVQVGVGLASQTEKSSGETNSAATGLAFNFGAGASYFIKENIAVNLGLSYTLASLKDSDDNKFKYKEGNFGANIGFSIFF